MDELMKEYFNDIPGTPRGCAKSSVYYGSNYRLRQARKQAKLPPVSLEEIVEYVNEFFTKTGMETVIPEMCIKRIKSLQEIDYKAIKEKYNLKSERDIVWMKFTTDGYLGVVAASADINFQMPESKDTYLKKKNKFVYNTSGILVHSLRKKWDTSFVLLFPLSSIPDGYSRCKIEKGIGNYLIKKGVPVLDYYSHNY